jgi:outer membrane protein assembly factor BamE
MSPPIVYLAAVLLVFLIGGCASQDVFLRPYRIEVVQGNVLTQEQVALVQIGQTKTQVREVLGAPLLSDAFHANRWDYVFTISRQGAAPQQHRVLALFDGEALQAIEGAKELPTEQEFVRSIDTFKPLRTPPPLTLTPEQIKALPTPPPPSSKVQNPAPVPGRIFPPLERT